MYELIGAAVGACFVGGIVLLFWLLVGLEGRRRSFSTFVGLDSPEHREIDWDVAVGESPAVSDR